MALGEGGGGGVGQLLNLLLLVGQLLHKQEH